MSTLIDKVRQFSDGFAILCRWLGSGAETVSPELAQSRADVCLKCPKNKNIAPLTVEAAMEIRRQVSLKNHLYLILKGEENLHTCEACSCVLKLKCWLPMSRIRPDPNEMEKFHPDCWLRKS